MQPQTKRTLAARDPSLAMGFGAMGATEASLLKAALASPPDCRPKPGSDGHARESAVPLTLPPMNRPQLLGALGC